MRVHTTLRLSVLAFAALALFVSGAERALAQAFTVTIQADESGNGTLSNSNGFLAPLAFTVGPDAGPGGLANALIYDLFNPPGLVPGDVRVLDASGLTDLIRFNSLSFTGGSGELVLYSLLGGGQLADKGFPSANYTNLVTGAEIAGVITYTPTAGQPGFVAGAGGPVTYIITSPEAVPEPSSLALFTISGLALSVSRLWQRRTGAKGVARA